MELFNLSKQYNFYKEYHKNEINVLIHVICIPIITWTLSVFLTHFSTSLYYNPTFYLTNIYSVYYNINRLLVVQARCSWRCFSQAS